MGNSRLLTSHRFAGYLSEAPFPFPLDRKRNLCFATNHIVVLGITLFECKAANWI